MASLNDIETKVQSIIDILKSRTVKTITGTLPLTFTAKAGNAVDWVIYGNDESYNLFDIETVRFKYADVTIAIKDNSTGTLQCSCDGTYAYSQVNYSTNFENGKAYTISCTNELANTKGAYFAILRADTLATMVKISLSTIGQKSATFTYSDSDFPQGAIAVFVLATTATASEINVTNMMITLGSTAPDHYIPYQQGVGERTANLFDFQQFAGGTQTVTNGGLTFTRDNDTIVINNSSTVTYPQVFLNSDDGINVPVLEATTYNVQLYVEDAPQAAEIYVDIYGKNTLDDSWHYINLIKPQNRNITISTAYAYYAYKLIVKGMGITYLNTKVRIQIIKGSTAPSTYIPYGYQIPITISQTGQTDKTVDIYIGDAPLTEGETVSKTSTGVDLELFEGENTVSTTLYNKPEMTIKYKYNGGN